MGANTTEIGEQTLISTPKSGSRSGRGSSTYNNTTPKLKSLPSTHSSSPYSNSHNYDSTFYNEIKADEISMSTKWSPQLKSAEKKSIAQRLRDQNTPIKNGLQQADQISKNASPLFYKAKTLESPENLPPLSPLVNSIKATRNRDLLADTPFFFSPTRKLSTISNKSEEELRSPLTTKSKKLKSPQAYTKASLLSLSDAHDHGQHSSSDPTAVTDDETPNSKTSRILFDGMKIGTPTAKKAKHSSDDFATSLNTSESTNYNANEIHTILSPQNFDTAKPILDTTKTKLNYSQLASIFKETKLSGFVQKELKKIQSIFDQDFGWGESDFIQVTTACGLPRYLNKAFFLKATKTESKSNKRKHMKSWPEFSSFAKMWTKLRNKSVDKTHLVFELLLDDDCRHLKRSDFIPLVTDVVLNHPELEFLEEQQVFAKQFAETIIERMFYEANCYNGDSMTLQQFRRIDLLNVIQSLEVGVDVDVEKPTIFSYKHFYVIFCSFYELDEDHDSLLEPKNLLRYFDGSLSMRAINRVMMGKGKTVSKNDPLVAEKLKTAISHKSKKSKKPTQYMTYQDFIWFLISEVDKTSKTASDYWFRCLDLDEDGLLSVYELEYFYEEQMRRMAQDTNGDIIPLEDIACQLFDLTNPKSVGVLSQRDIHKMPSCMRPIFFDAFVNLARFCEHDSRSSLLQKQLSQFTGSLEKGLSFAEIIDRRIEFLNSAPPIWIEFADCEYEALIVDQQSQN